MKRFATRFVKTSIASVVLLGCFVLAILTITSWRVASYDEGYDSVNIGGHVDDVEILLGPPHDVDFPLNPVPVLVDAKHPLGWGFCPPGQNVEQLIEQGKLSADYTDRVYVYRLERTWRPSVRWTIGLSPSGKVVRKHRDDNGC